MDYPYCGGGVHLLWPPREGVAHCERQADGQYAAVPTEIATSADRG